MNLRAIGLLALSIFPTGQANAQSAAMKPLVGDHLFIELSGDIAQEYAARMGIPTKQMPGLSISTSATIEQQLADGTYRVGHHTPVKSASKPRMVTLTAVVDPAKITADVTPANTPVYVSPAVHENGGATTRSTSDQTDFRIKLSELKGVKLQTWELVEEISK